MTTTRERPLKPTPARSGVARAIERATGWAANQPLLDYKMLSTIILVLAGLGVVMVTSSSMATSVWEDTNVWAQPLKQAIMVALGLIGFWLMLRINPERVRAWSPWIMMVAVVLLIVVLTPLGTGREEVGSQSWIPLPGFQLQPSEFAKVAIAIWGASLLANKDPKQLFSMSNGFLPFILVSSLCFVLIGLQGDIGMAFSFAFVVAFALIFAGIGWSLIGVVAGIGVAIAAGVMFAGGFRSHRFHTFFDAFTGNIEDTQGTGYQSYQGFLSLADGSFFGVGLGQSRAKWFYLPEAKNDFIFAIIGEELGLWGGALVILLFLGLAFFGLRAARRAQSQYQALLAATLTMGVVSQAFVNIAYVIGLLPVTGIQLPMISAGGTSAVITLSSMGLLVAVARHEPDAVSSMQNHGRPFFDRIFLLPEPQPLRGKGLHDDHTTATNTPERATTPRRRRYGTPVTARSATPRTRSDEAVRTAPRAERTVPRTERTTPRRSPRATSRSSYSEHARRNRR